MADKNLSSVLKLGGEGSDEDDCLVRDACFSYHSALIAAGYDDRTIRVRRSLVTKPCPSRV